MYISEVIALNDLYTDVSLFIALLRSRHVMWSSVSMFTMLGGCFMCFQSIIQYQLFNYKVSKKN